MKTKQITLLALSLTLGVMVTPSFALKNGDSRVETSRTVTRGTNNGQNGYWIENTRKTYTFIIDDTLNSALTDAGINNLDPALADKIRANIINGVIGVDDAIANIKKLSDLNQQNKNSNYPNNLNQAFLSSTGAITAQVADSVGAWGQGSGVSTKITAAYQALGINPTTKKLPNGQTLSSDFNTMIKQLKDGGYITLDYDFDALISDVGEQNIINMASARGATLGYQAIQSNLFYKQNLEDPSLNHTWWYSYGANSADTADNQDSTVRAWIKASDGIGSFNNTSDLDFYMAVAYSSAAKLDAQSKALSALGLTAEANAKMVAARNVILLTGNDHDPLALDLNHNGKIDVTGMSSARFRNTENNRFIKDGSVKFDLLANGKPLQIEWLKGGDGFLVDNRKNAAIAAITAGKNLTGVNLFGDIQGYPGGFAKLASQFDSEAKFAANDKLRLSSGYGVLKGDELKDLRVWIDNGDGIATMNELKTPKELGITEIGTLSQFNKEKGEALEQAYFIQNGEKYLIQEVWFKSEQK